MQVAFKLVPPAGTRDEEIIAIGSELKEMEGIQGAGSTQSRAIDPVSLLVWVKLSAEVVAVVGAAVKVIYEVVQLFRKRGMKGTTIEFADGRKLSMDDATVDEIKALVEALRN